MGSVVRDRTPSGLSVAEGRQGERYKPAQVRFYLDADILGLAKLLVQVRPDVTYPGDPGGVLHKRRRPPCQLAVGTLDKDWIPEVAAQGWLIITRDSAIQGHSREIGAMFEHGARMVALASSDAKGKFDQLEVFMTNWRKIERCTMEPGPFIYVATRTTFRPIDL